MTAMTRIEAANVIAKRLSTGKLGAAPKFATRVWQGNDGSPPLIRIYIDAKDDRTSLGFVAIDTDGTPSFDRITKQASAIKRAVGKALHGVDIMPEDVVNDNASTVKVMWSGVTNGFCVPVQVVNDDGNDCVMVRDDVGEWVRTDDDAIVLDALWSAVNDMVSSNRR